MTKVIPTRDRNEVRGARCEVRGARCEVRGAGYCRREIYFARSF